MKILALPLTAKTPKRDALTYYHFITRTPAPPSQQNYVGKAQAKAASIWADFGKAEGGWKVSRSTQSRPTPSFASTNEVFKHLHSFKNRVF
jgi:hypothetical protein